MSWLKTFGAPLLGCLVIAGVVHAGVVLAAPGFIMAKAMDRLSLNGSRVNVWTHAKRASPTQQPIVRASPDLAYSSCVWDLSGGPVRITAPRWDGYFSLSMFNANTDNFFVANDRNTRGPVDVLLATRSQTKGLTAPAGSKVVVSPSVEGVALLRYLAPSPEEFARADAIRSRAVCEEIRRNQPGP